MNRCIIIFIILTIVACQSKQKITQQTMGIIKDDGIQLIVLGTMQDAGSPHIACTKDCCKDLFDKPTNLRKVVSLGIVDNINQQTWLFEATPDLPVQLKWLKEAASFEDNETPNGIFLTHAHIGHYTGLMYLGKEAMGAKQIPVYAMPRMKNFLETNGPWSQLVKQQNIDLYELTDEQSVTLSSQLKVVPFTVPHRDEYSETVGYRIEGPNKKVLFIPDIDKWERWQISIEKAIAEVDYAFLDATFYDAAEVNYRDISQIPHPFIIESMQRFDKLSPSEKEKIYFIHFNHTNPALDMESKAYKTIRQNGFNIAVILDQFSL